MSDLLTPKEVAGLLKVTTGTLEAWRGKRKGPPFLKLGDGLRSRVRYRRDDVEAFLRARHE